ncbi:MAG: hypothetical protein M3Y27_27325 [Acidobacteriota bacterium]|nr:hypothetical protein [Acidobacteriota bacterium]
MLTRHLEQVEQSLALGGFTVGTLVIGGEAVPDPTLFERAEEPQEAGVALMRLIRRALIEGEFPAQQTVTG